MNDPAPGSRPEAETLDELGDRLRRFRAEQGLTASALAIRSGVSKSYLSSLESDSLKARRPSVQTLQRLASALGVLLSDLTGLAPTPGADRSPELVAFAEAEGLPDADVDMLASIQFRGKTPQRPERWRYIYNAIRTSELLDRDVE
jgi:transcriptional regulator with XRE-family HTH domain